ncbi:MAG TPA: class I SAM-dependent methyltransferase [Candidatus Methylomirabilis sp.]|nr:class I SAM-dependent methyltransferase [Candidatus Methylomirabilis sp.]
MARHPESDVRPWIEGHVQEVNAYTRQRIEGSYRFIDGLLASCQELGSGHAYDVGSGAGFDTFAIGRHFDSVWAVDTNPSAIREAVRIARGAGVTHITFKRRSAESFRGVPASDFVYCNLMSHHVSSRCRLIRRLGTVLKPRAYLSYSEITEGYAPMEIHRAIQRRDGVELASRLCQVVRGFTGQAGFRFFLAGTAPSLLEMAGLRVVARDSLNWNGMTIHERILSQGAEGPRVVRGWGCDADYVGLASGFAETRAQFLAQLPAKSGARLPSGARADDGTVLRPPCDAYAPFLTFLRMAEMVLPSLRLRPSPKRRMSEIWQGARRRLGFAADRSPSRTNLDWGALEDIDLEFIAMMRRNAGLPAGEIDE